MNEKQTKMFEVGLTPQKCITGNNQSPNIQYQINIPNLFKDQQQHKTLQHISSHFCIMK